MERSVKLTSGADIEIGSGLNVNAANGTGYTVTMLLKVIVDTQPLFEVAVSITSKLVVPDNVLKQCEGFCNAEAGLPSPKSHVQLLTEPPATVVRSPNVTQSGSQPTAETGVIAITGNGRTVTVTVPVAGVVVHPSSIVIV